MSLYPFTFKAAVIEEHGQQLALKDIQFSGPLLAGQLLVKLKYSGICGKQIEEMDGTGTPDPWVPHLLGHEGSAEVIDVGPGVTKVENGDVVVLHWKKGSGIQSSTPLYYHEGTRINSGWVTTFNEYAVVSENRVTPLDKESDSIVTALLGCIATTGIGVVLNEAQVQTYDTVVVYGCGGIGLCTVQAANMVHPRKIIAIDIDERALAKAREFGATDVINALQEDVIQTVQQLTDGAGATKVIVATGHPTAIENAIEATSIPGDCILVGVPQKGITIQFEPWSVMHNRCIRGTLGGNVWPDRDIPAYYALYQNGHLPLDKLVTHVESFENINKAIEVMRRGSAGRCVIQF
jgi:S-(hydroxymethyl)glutathione dehydrogenase / alcohol dehydrogenase